MKGRPILFSGGMVRAILAGTKTQTRRVVKNLHPDCNESFIRKDDGLFGWRDQFGRFMQAFPCPYGQPGDRLWVREAFRFLDSFDGDSPATVGERCLAANYPKPWAPTQYEADGRRDNWMHVGTPRSAPGSPTPGKLRPGIHMPRWASRILLEITAVRVERLGQISEADASQEGVASVEEFIELWKSINGKWEPEQWTWVLQFHRA